MKRALLVVLLLLTLLGGCRKKQPAPPLPPVTLPPPIEPSKTPVVEAPAVQPQAPAVPLKTPPEEIVPQEPGKISPPPAPAAKPQPRSRSPRRSQPATQAATPSTTPAEKSAANPAPATAKVPQFGELLDDNQRNQYQQQYESAIAAARSSLAAISGVQLTRAQTNTAERVRGFIAEAEKMQSADIRTAAQLALRAASLGRDLRSSIN
jgi:hypothetical protein